MTIQRFFQSFVVPAAVFQSVVVGGGYGTGREIVEYISRHGPWGGLLALAVAGLSFGIVLALSFELARQFKAYDYRRFFKALLGRGWVLFEILFMAMLLVILAVTGSAAGSVLYDSFGIPKIVGVSAILILVTAITFIGRDFVEKTLTLWALAFTSVLGIYVVLAFLSQSSAIHFAFSTNRLADVWAPMFTGLQFSLYNVAVVPVILYCSSHIESRGEAMASGFFAGTMGVLPGLAFHVTFMAGYPAIMSQELPTYWLIGIMGIPLFLGIYVVALFGMIVQTGIGVLQGLNERIDVWYREKHGRSLSGYVHGAVSAAAMLASLLLASAGIVVLVAKGYGVLAWGFLAIYVLPLLVWGAATLTDRRTLPAGKSAP